LERGAQVTARWVAESHARDRSGPAREAILDLRLEQRVIEVILEPERHLGVGGMVGEPGVAGTERGQRGLLRRLGAVAARPRAGGEVAGTDARELGGAEAGGHRAVVQDLEPDEDLAGRDPDRGGDLRDNGVAVGHVEDRRTGHAPTIRLRNAQLSGQWEITD